MKGLRVSCQCLGILKSLTYEGCYEFGKKGKLSLRFIGPYLILQKVGQVAYELELPSGLGFVHPVCHVSMLLKRREDPSRVVPVEDV